MEHTTLRLAIVLSPLVLSLACGASEKTGDASLSFGAPPLSQRGSTSSQASPEPGTGDSGATAGSNASVEEQPGGAGLDLMPTESTPGGETAAASSSGETAPADGVAEALPDAGTEGLPVEGATDPGSVAPGEPPVQLPAEQPPAAPPPAQNADCAGLFFCDGFEGASAGASPDPGLWQVIDGYAPRDTSANVQVSSAMAHSGRQAVRVLGSGSRNGMVANLPQQSYFVRAWLQVDATPQGPVLIGVGADQNNEVRLRLWSPNLATVNVSQGDAVRPNGATSGNCPSCVTLTANRWFCAEMQIDNSTRSARLWIDGVEAANLPNGDGGVPAQPASPALFLGSMGLQGGQTGVWIDDVAAGPQRIGCD